MTLSQIELVVGLCGGDFNTLTPSLTMDSSRCWAKNAIAIMQQVFVRLLQSNRLTQLLQRPSRSRVRGDIAMNQASTAMLDDHEYIQLSKGYGDGEEKATGNDPLGMQPKKGRPAHIASRSTCWSGRQILAGHRS
jgi:hypothetical protein